MFSLPHLFHARRICPTLNAAAVTPSRSSRSNLRAAQPLLRVIHDDCHTCLRAAQHRPDLVGFRINGCRAYAKILWDILAPIGVILYARSAFGNSEATRQSPVAEGKIELNFAFGLTPRALCLLGAGFLWLVPGYYIPRLAYGMLVWDGLILVVALLDGLRLPPAGNAYRRSRVAVCSPRLGARWRLS